ncbi:ATP-binding cassette domain-containing protein [Peptostreptococcus stomatis]|uniref:ABC transporter, ATP-binding protein n=1 Tax=Peptostreptococcus stomatis DSM 17678 TaxID=596315 RepID=E0E2K3_9FIRM|nr:ATP-binding cassette domain-containing protein [Peptostreptococcus stomatis]EFM64881.1 ABC transporter, ATP-binding protein [Peptostreptococcus stomatis DSM 17678]MBL6465833.1 ATP-binding cassette domain-containing protein [Peptostreptococcus stomatis]
MKYIEVNNYTKIIKGMTVLDNINLTLEKGSLSLIVGGNGSGKTMLLRALSGLIFPTSGEILIDGKKLIFNEKFPVDIGICIEQNGMQSNISGFENLAYLANINKIIDKEEILRYMKLFDIYKYKDMKFKKYSLGMKKKLALIQAVMENQDLMIFDEPLNGLDEKSIDVFVKLLEEEKAKGKTIIIATHKQNIFENILDRVFEMYNGRLKRIDG